MPDAIDRPTLIAVAVVAYALTNVAHEGLGHGGACVLVGGRPVALNAVYFDCDSGGLSKSADRCIAAGGTLVNLARGLLSAIALGLGGRRATMRRYFLWLFMTLNLLQGTGYWLFSGIAGIGDWVVVIHGKSPQWLWRIALAVAGVAGYLAATWLALRILASLIGDDAGRLRRAATLARVPYFAGGILYVSAGLLNPVSVILVLISAAAASFGGTSALAWMTELLHSPARFPVVHQPPLTLARSPGWMGLGLVTAAVFIGILGPSIQF